MAEWPGPIGSTVHLNSSYDEAMTRADGQSWWWTLDHTGMCWRISEPIQWLSTPSLLSNSSFLEAVDFDWRMQQGAPPPVHENSPKNSLRCICLQYVGLRWVHNPQHWCVNQCILQVRDIARYVSNSTILLHINQPAYFMERNMENIYISRTTQRTNTGQVSACSQEPVDSTDTNIVETSTCLKTIR